MLTSGKKIYQNNIRSRSEETNLTRPSIMAFQLDKLKMDLARIGKAITNKTSILGMGVRKRDIQIAINNKLILMTSNHVTLSNLNSNMNMLYSFSK
jgi:hypothetical protein